MKEKSRIGSIDFIRAISVIMIIMFHFIVEALQRGFNLPETYYITKFGAYGVTFFIVISGGGIFSSSKGRFSTIYFYKKRFLNIIPPYWVSFFVMSIFLYIFYNKITIGPNLLLLLVTITGMDGYLSSSMTTYFTVGEWFVGFIILMYVFYPLILLALKKSQFITFLACVIAAIFFYHNNDKLHEIIPLWNKYPMFNPLIRLPEFIFGVLFFDAISRNKRNLYLYLSTALIVYLFYIIKGVEDDYNLMNVPRYISVFVILTSAYEILLSKIKIFNQIFIWMSKYSFMAFLFHHQIVYALGRNGNINNMNDFAFYFGCAMAVIISYICAIIFTPVTNNIQNFIKTKINA